MTSTDLYQYQPLSSPKAIRVMRLKPALHLSDPIHYTLMETSLGSDGEDSEFEALSYTWGGQTPQHPSSCEGRNLLVTKNVEEALRYLRFEKTVRVLWIDAVCINQADLREKGCQVRLMAEVYQEAYQTIIWLGSGSDNCRLLKFPTIDLLLYLHRNLFRLQSLSLELGSPGMLRFVRNSGDKCFRWLESRRYSFFGNVKPLLRHPWFSRVWTVQELACSKRVLLVHGHDSLDGGQLGNIVDSLVYWTQTRHPPLSRHDQDLNLYVLRKKMPSLRSKRTFESSAWQELVIQELLDVAALNLSGDARDKFFGLHAFFKYWGVPTIEPDYELATSEVYEANTIACIKSARSLSVLWYSAVPQSGGLSLATWIPDLCKSSFAMPWLVSTNMYGGETEPSIPGNPRRQPFLLDADLELIASRLPGQLPFMGYSKCSVVSVSKQMPSKETGTLKDILCILCLWMRLLREHRLSDLEIRYFVCDFSTSDSERGRKERILYINGLSIVEQTSRAHHFESLISDVLDNKNSCAKSLALVASDLPHGTYLLMTDLGPGIASCRASPKVGDIIVLSNQELEPFIMRPTGEGPYSFVGLARMPCLLAGGTCEYYPKPFGEPTVFTLV